MSEIGKNDSLPPDFKPVLAVRKVNLNSNKKNTPDADFQKIVYNNSS